MSDLESIFMIEKIWIDPLENDIPSAVGYKPVGYTTNEDRAKVFCAKGREFNKEDCWAISNPMPEYRYRPLQKII